MIELKVTAIGNSLGVVLPKEALARLKLAKGDALYITETSDGYRLTPYDPAFEQPLHKAVEFSWLETRQGWVRARLPDASEGWLRESDCLQVK